ERFIGTARHLQAHGAMDFEYVEEGELTHRGHAVVPNDIDRKSICFEHGDATDLPVELGTFDVVLMANLIDRLHDPRRCLLRLAERLKSGGQLVITSPYTWLEQYTPKEN